MLFLIHNMRLTLITNVPPASSSPTTPAHCWHASPRSAAGTGAGAGTGTYAHPWPEALHPKSLCIHLNFQGEAQLTPKSGPPSILSPQTLTWSRSARSAHRTTTRDRHECLTLVYPDAWLIENLRALLPQLPDPARQLVSKPFAPFILPGRSLTDADLAWTRNLISTPFCDAARPLLDSARLTDFLLRELFTSAADTSSKVDLISRAERAAQERVERIKAHLLKHLDENHDLDTLASAVGCSPHYLSRTFAQVTGTPLMLWIRRARIDRAAGLIATGRCNVSEAALEVGYRSFSHFSRAFQQEKSVPPSKWIHHLAQARLAPKTNPP
jgi:AraC-like DNA-binding protein